MKSAPPSIQSTLIIGAGSVGLGIASCIASSTDWPLTLLTRTGRAASFADSGFSRSGIFGGVRIPAARFSACDNPSAVPLIAGRPFDLILVCTKSFDSEPAAESIAGTPGLFGPLTKIVLFHNGWGSTESFAGRFSRRQIFNARVITGFKRPDPVSVDITVHADDIRLGSLFYPDESDLLQELAAAISAGGIPAQVTNKVGHEIWSKMLYNCALNPLGAILNATYGALGDSAESRSIMNRVIDECYLVMKAAGNVTHWNDPDGFREAFYERMIPPTYVHESSMLQDIRAGRRTEIDYLSGAIVGLGQKHGIPTPVNALLCDQVRFLEQRSLRAEK